MISDLIVAGSGSTVVPRSPKTSLPVITRWWKGSTARQANLILGRTGEAFWQDESFDHRVRDEVELDRIAHCVEYHPVSAA
jgi:hypothetical protein